MIKDNLDTEANNITNWFRVNRVVYFILLFLMARTKSPAQKKLNVGSEDSESPSGKDSSITREQRAHNVAIIFQSILEEHHFSRDCQINEASFEDIWSEDHFCRISGYDIECVVKSLRQMAFHDGD